MRLLSGEGGPSPAAQPQLSDSSPPPQNQPRTQLGPQTPCEDGVRKRAFYTFTETKCFRLLNLLLQKLLYVNRVTDLEGMSEKI